MKAIANLKKRFVVQIVVAWKPCADENVLEMAVLGESASEETHSLTVLVSQTKCGEMLKYSAIFQMIIIMHVNVYRVSYYTVIQIKS